MSGIGSGAYHRDAGAIVELEIGDRGVDVGHCRCVVGLD